MEDNALGEGGRDRSPTGGTVEERLATAQKAFELYYSRCFWFMDRSLRVTEDLLPRIVDGLRRHGDRRAFQIATELCR